MRFIIYTILFLLATSFSLKTEKIPQEPIDSVAASDSILLRFAFIGCNRIGRNSSQPYHASTANIYALKRIFKEVAAENRKPDLFFFLGDLVLGESDTSALNKQLSAWVNLYKDTAFSTLSNSDIELVAVPGNHEMLYYNDSLDGEFPLEYASQVWLKYMKPYMPKDRVTSPGGDIDQMTFTFTRENVGFVVMNTDTYNAPSSGNGVGKEGQVPVSWITKTLDSLKNLPQIEHIFVLGHKPYYIGTSIAEGHTGFNGAKVWKKMENVNAVAMLWAHVHHYISSKPSSVYQIIAGNGGSPEDSRGNDCPEHIGYTIINVMKSGKIKLESKGFSSGIPCWTPVPGNPTQIIDTIWMR